MIVFNRRSFLLGVALSAMAPVSSALSKPLSEIHVVKGRGCGCCTVWSDILKNEGFLVTETEMHPADLMQLKLSRGIPQDMTSCHTAQIMDYVIEGHVPPADIKRLLADQPDALGLAVPGMPYGSPGMGPEEEREAYDVFLLRKNGTSEVFSSYKAAS